MKSNDYPGIYQAADALSARGQKGFLKGLTINIAFLIAASLLSFITVKHWGIALAQAVLMAAVLGSTAYLALARPEKTWYAGRAVAESIKTLVWRYVSRAEPFNDVDLKASQDFLDKLRDVVNQNKAVTNQLVTHLSNDQITPVMKDLRLQGLHDRLAVYVQCRIRDQLDWYSQKAEFNRVKSNKFFWCLLFLNASAFALALLKIKFYDFEYFPIDFIITISACVLTWIQAKRYSELSESYALAANEIGIIKHQSEKVATEEGFSLFVGDAENAFSREHTQWVARKDN